MLELLDIQEMNQVLGGTSNYCEKLVQMANNAEDWSPEEWDAWIENYEEHCGKA